MLWDNFLTNTGRVIHKWEHYFPAYEENFSAFRNKDILFLEIGCGQGGSLQLWRRYFGPLATIVGIDINPACSTYEEPGIFVRIGDQSDTEFLQSIINEFGIPQIVLDDGSHVMNHINSSFDFLYPLMSPNSVYMVEDLHTAYWEEYGGGVTNSKTFINRTKQFIDLLNADHSRGVIAPTDFTNNTYSIHIYDSIVSLRKGRVKRKFAPQIGTI
jgi:SAM-dependent methyltransferase